MFTTVTTVGNGWHCRMLYVTKVLCKSWKNDQEMLKSSFGEENSNWTRHVSRRCSTERHNFYPRQSMPSPHHPAPYNDALSVCNVTDSDIHAVMYYIWMFGNVQVMEIEDRKPENWKLVYDNILALWKSKLRPSTTFHRFPTHLFNQLLSSWNSEIPWMERNFRASEVQQCAKTVPELL